MPSGAALTPGLASSPNPGRFLPCTDRTGHLASHVAKPLRHFFYLPPPLIHLQGLMTRTIRHHDQISPGGQVHTAYPKPVATHQTPLIKEHEVARGRLLKKLRAGDKAPVVRETFMSCRIRMQKGMWLALSQANHSAPINSRSATRHWCSLDAGVSRDLQRCDRTTW